MEIKILDSILHGQLKPWKVDTGNSRRLVEVIRSAKASDDVMVRLQSLLQDFPPLQKIVTEEGNAPVQALTFQPKLPAYTDPGTQFYYLLITTEAQRIFSFLLHRSKEWEEPVDLIYHVGKTLNSVKVLAVQTAGELNERGFAVVPDEQSDLIHFALFCLKHTLIALYFSIQGTFRESLLQTTSLEDFYLLDLQEPLSNNVGWNYAEPEIGKGTSSKFSFAFKGNKDALKAVLTQLTIKLDLVNEKLNTVDELLQLLTAKEIKPGAVVINIGCETVEFRYILDQLKPFFKKLTIASIGRSESFKSKGGTVYNNQLLYSSKIETPKRKAEIDNIIKHMK